MKFLKIPAVILLMCGRLFAQDAAPQAQNPLSGMFPLIVIFAIFYFLLIRPQQKKAKEHQLMLTGIKKDDKIVTSGGIYGVVTSVKGDILEVRIAEGVKVQIAKSAVSEIAKETAAVVQQG